MLVFTTLQYIKPFFFNNQLKVRSRSTFKIMKMRKNELDLKERGNVVSFEEQ